MKFVPLIREAVLSTEEGPETEITDLIADLMHVAEEEGVDFDTCLNRAVAHFEAEKDESNG